MIICDSECEHKTAEKLFLKNYPGRTYPGIWHEGFANGYHMGGVREELVKKDAEIERLSEMDKMQCEIIYEKENKIERLKTILKDLGYEED